MNNKKVLVLTFSLIVVLSLKASQGLSIFKAGFPDVAKPLFLSDLQNPSENKSEICYYLGNTYFLEGNTDSAYYYFNEGFEANHLYLQNKIGLTMLRMKEVTDSEINNEINKVFSENKNAKKDISLIISISYAYLYNGKINSALEYQSKARSLQPKNPLVFLLLGDIYKQTDLGLACQNYETAILYDENCVEAYIKYARAYKNVNPQLSLEKLMILKKIAPNFSLLDRELGDVYYSMNDFKKSAEYYANYLNSGNIVSSSDLIKYSMTLFFNHDFEKSLIVARSGLELDKKNPVFYRLIMYNTVDLKKFNDALVAADSLFNKKDVATISFLDYKYYGEALKETNQLELAVQALQNAFDLDQTKVDVLKEISDLYADKRDYVMAIAFYKKYQELTPNSDKKTDKNIALVKLYYRLGTDSIYNQEQIKSALLAADTICAETVKLNTEDYRGIFWRARVNSALDPDTKQGLAKPYYAETAKFIEGKKDSRYNNVLIECYSYLGWYMLLNNSKDISMEYWQKILNLDPNNLTAKKGVESLKSTGFIKK